LYRPGCLDNGWHIQYCNRKHGKEKVEYMHESVADVLKDTYGVCAYQEQFISIINRLGDISLSDSDTIRAALGKKDEAKLKRFRKTFIKNAAKKVGSVDGARRIWEQLEKSSNYSFTKSHSAVYSILAYVSQFFKVYHPVEFWTAHLEWDVRKNRRDDMLRHKKAAREMGVIFKPPHINQSGVSFRIVEKAPVWSFMGLKGLGPKAAVEIEKHQPYEDFEDFYKRVNKSKVKFNNIVSLIYVGAFDSMGDRREFLKALFKLKTKKPPSLKDEAMMMQFYEIMGFFEQGIKEAREVDDCITQVDLENVLVGEQVRIGGMLVNIRRIKTKTGEPMGFGTVVDVDESIDLTFFPKTWAKYRGSISDGKILKVDGVKSGWGGKTNAVEVEKVEEF